jgi:hypothetical protein
MVEGGHSFGFALKTSDALASRHFGRKNLQSHLTAELRVLGYIDLSHAASAEFPEDLVVRKDLAYHK